MTDAAFYAALEHDRALLNQAINVHVLGPLLALHFGPIEADHVHVYADGRMEPVECGCIPGHQVSVVTQACVRCGLTEREFDDHGNRPCARGLWPRDVAVPRRNVPGIRNAPLGTEEGDLCLRSHSGLSPCLGKLELRPLDGAACYCGATRAPCGSCLSWAPECSRCGHREDEA